MYGKERDGEYKEDDEEEDDIWENNNTSLFFSADKQESPIVAAADRGPVRCCGSGGIWETEGGGGCFFQGGERGGMKKKAMPTCSPLRPQGRSHHKILTTVRMAASRSKIWCAWWCIRIGLSLSRGSIKMSRESIKTKLMPSRESGNTSFNLRKWWLYPRMLAHKGSSWMSRWWQCWTEMGGTIVINPPPALWSIGGIYSCLDKLSSIILILIFH